MRTMSNPIEVAAAFSEINVVQSELIEVQRKAIDGLFALLCQHISVEEIETIEAYRQMNKAAALKEALDRKEGVFYGSNNWICKNR